VLFAAVFAVFKTASIGDVGIRQILHGFIPNLSYLYWFPTTYFLLYLFIPLINFIVSKLSKKLYLTIICFFSVIMVSVPYILKDDLKINGCLFVGLYYLIAGYIRLYCNKPIKKNWINLLLGSLIYLLIPASMVLYDSTEKFRFLYPDGRLHFEDFYSPFIMFSAVFVFLFFQGCKSFCSKKINIIAGTAFGIYLIHDNSYLSRFLWIGLLKNSSFYQSNLLIIHAILSAVFVFVICSLIDLCRKHTIERLIMPPIYKLYDKIYAFISSKIKNNEKLVRFPLFRYMKK
jgi:hypothetical protein